MQGNILAVPYAAEMIAVAMHNANKCSNEPKPEKRTV